MSYNTRRSGGFGGNQSSGQQGGNVSNIGQRRPVVTNNFVPGGQLNPQNKPGYQANPPLRPPQQPPAQQQGQGQNVNTSINFRQQQQQQQQQKQGYQQQSQQPPQQHQPTPQQQPQQQQQQQQPPPPVKPEPQSPAAKNVIQGANPPNPALENANGDNMDTSAGDDQQTPRKRPFWWRGGHKISKKEKMRRRNLRLSKILQPKNAVMILNELVKNTSYMVEELSAKLDTNQFKATVLVEGAEHSGYGRSKIHAKNDAAEVALRHFVKSHRLTDMTKDDEGNEQMDVSQPEDATQPSLPWQHVASFALYKLFSSWGEDPNNVKASKLLQIQAQLNNSTSSEKHHENKPAKKLPDNPETMNPLMLLNQMLPNAQFEEIGKSGNPPNVTYSFRCNVSDQSFIGTGPSKKAAKKQAAFGACHKVLSITYPTDVYVPIY